MADLKPGWQRVKFGELANCINDRIDDPSTAGVKRYVGLEHLDPESLTIRRWGSPEDVESTKLLFKPGDIIFGKRRAYQRKLAVADFEGICSAHAMVLRAKPAVVFPEFLPYFMQSDLFMDRAVEISVGSLSPTINWKALAQQEFALPPLDQQRRISTLLKCIVATVNSQAELASAQQKLIGSLITQNETSLPRIKLGDVYEIIGGFAFKSTDYSEKGTPLMRIGSIENGKATLNEATKFLPLHFLADFKGYAVKNGDLLVGLSEATTGKSGLYLHDMPSLLNQRVARLRIRPSYAFDEAFFRHSLNLLEPTILKSAGGSAQPNISTGSLSAIEVSCPSQSRRKGISETILRFEKSNLLSTKRASFLRHIMTNLLAL